MKLLTFAPLNYVDRYLRKLQFALNTTAHSLSLYFYFYKELGLFMSIIRAKTARISSTMDIAQLM